jgi:hypothetical protein
VIGSFLQNFAPFSRHLHLSPDITRTRIKATAGQRAFVDANLTPWTQPYVRS